MRIERLQFIADHCPQLRVEALKMALSFVQRTFNVDVYEEIHRKLSEATRYWEAMGTWGAFLAELRVMCCTGGLCM